MPSDALHYSFLAKELDARLRDGKIEKISMPEKDEIILGIRARGENLSLLISASPAGARCHLTTKRKENPLAAPSFLMHLRKHIGGAKILSVSSIHCERIVRISLLTRNELADEEHKTLIAEIMGKYSNIILVGGDGRISDCIRKVGADVSSKRQVLPGLKYESAPAQDRIDPIDSAAVENILQDFSGGEIAPYIISRVKGLAPISAEEAAFRAVGRTSCDKLDAQDIRAIARELRALYDDGDIHPCLLSNGGKTSDFFIRPYSACAGNYCFFPTLCEAMDEYFFNRDKVNRFNEKSRHLLTLLKNAMTRAEKKLRGFIEKRDKCSDSETDRLNGELILGNIYRIKTGSSSVVLENWYDDNKAVTVPLDPTKTPQNNAQDYFKRYAKKKKTLEQLEPLIKHTSDDLEYYSSIALSFSTCKENSEIDDLAYELEQAGILKKKREGNKQKIRHAPSSPLCVVCDGFTVKIGKNNVQNDALTRSAKADDIWLHTRAIHGSHVIICAEGKTVPKETIIKAAAYAAGYSKAANSQNVPVDYTLVKFVNKPSGAPLGKVVYTHQSTVFVNPAPPLS